MTALDVSGLSHHFGSRPALTHLSFVAPPGSFNVLLGPNGAGKTTLISLLTGLYHARSGAISVFGYSLRENPTEALKCMGVVFQHSTLDLDLSVRENLRYQASLYGLSSAEAKERQETELARLGISKSAVEPARTLSGGMRRRVEIAAALLHRPRLLLLDEATVGLDVSTRRLIIAHIRQLCRGQQLTVLWATHLLDEVDDADTVLLLHKGHLRWAGNAPGLMARAGTSTLADAFLRLTEDRTAT